MKSMKKKLTLSVDETLIVIMKEEKINISDFLEEAIAEKYGHLVRVCECGHGYVRVK